MQNWMTKGHKVAKREGRIVFIHPTYTKVHFSFEAPAGAESYYTVDPQGMGRKYVRTLNAEGTAFTFQMVKEASVLASV